MQVIVNNVCSLYIPATVFPGTLKGNIPAAAID